MQKQLQDLVIECNHHRVHKTITAEVPGGIPEVLYLSPESGNRHFIDCVLILLHLYATTV